MSASACCKGPGSKGLAPEPFPGLPPELIFARAPLRVTPPASSVIQLPPALTVSSLPASITSFWPALR
ncbi:hypothetical protein D3C78_1830620 [compost metagenome]